MSNPVLYAITVVAWGCSFFAVKLQLGVVEPSVSVFYRFVLAGTIMLGLMLVTGRRITEIPLKAHPLIAAQGLTLFCCNFWLVYEATQYMASGLAAIIFSTAVIFNIMASALFFRTGIDRRTLIGASLGIVGIAAVFWPAIVAFDVHKDGSVGLIYGLLGTISASTGMQLSAYAQKRGLPVVRTNGLGMAYGAMFAFLISLAQGAEFKFDFSPVYLLSMAYLSVIASVVAFWSFLTLIGRIGPARASYATVMFPILALIISGMLEDYVWTARAIAGVALVVIGNVVVLSRRPDAQTEEAT